MTQDRLRLVQLAEQLRQAWSRPHPAFASGMDARSSENALLLQFHGSLVKAAGLGWQNAGRTLVDKTYLRILKDCFGLDFHGFAEDELAARLDGFIRQALAPRWGQIIGSGGSEGLPLASELLDACNGALFASERLQAATHQVLFYLCPHLPFLPGFGELAQGAEQHQALVCSLPPLPRPQQFAGSTQQQVLIRQLVEGSDWWGRRVLSARQAEMAPARCAP
ncbi:hypothetical protein NJI34_18770 [Pseudomonas sp. S 311-6]|uniref:hypothetical protein n=1 Tax=Pseudomonas TaxID=286 RepID=UPI001CE4454A|nr:MULTISPECIES: hypothetical protein [Pseudomonas]MCO7564532.1 hypothetical protein [Pseudomonas mosselii]MCO7615934.1 hypothetical protein [Pseudomonas guariconensis]MCO7638811.1 hypothetical protein [Pseudomonas sp. S 311-6]